MKKLNLNKRVVSVLTDQEKVQINGGGTTSRSNCTGILCCDPKGCDPQTGSDCPSYTCTTRGHYTCDPTDNCNGGGTSPNDPSIVNPNP